MKTCALCKKNKELRLSHVIPSFVGKWLKETSATGLLRGLTDADKRLQDVGKTWLLCNDCEQRISALETYFANEVFYPFVESGRRNFKYDSRLLRFVISLSWRTLVSGYNSFGRILPQLLSYVNVAEATWSNYLLDISRDCGPYEHHVFFFDCVKDEKEMPANFQWYSLRAVDSTLLGNKEQALVYTKFPWMMFVSTIQPTQLQGWKNTKISERGEIEQPQSIHDDLFGHFLLSRYNSILDKKPLQTKIDTRIVKTLEKNPSRFFRSKSLETFFIEAQRERKRRKELLHPAVQSLIEIVEAASEDLNLTEEQRAYQRFGRHILADALSKVSGNEELEIASLMESALHDSRTRGEDERFVFKGKEITIIFMINLYSDQDQRYQIVSSELDDQIEKKKEGEKRHFMVVSWTPFEPIFPYISEFYIDDENVSSR
jgi:hypothetical protein